MVQQWWCPCAAGLLYSEQFIQSCYRDTRRLKNIGAFFCRCDKVPVRNMGNKAHPNGKSSGLFTEIQDMARQPMTNEATCNSLGRDVIKTPHHVCNIR